MKIKGIKKELLKQLGFLYKAHPPRSIRNEVKVIPVYV